VISADTLVYFGALDKVLTATANALRPGGFLMLGHSESLINDSTAFEIAQLAGDLVYRKPLSSVAP